MSLPNASFSVHIKVNPLRTHNKRTTYIRSLESLGQKVMAELTTSTVLSAGVTINGRNRYGEPGARFPIGVAATPQFAQNSARLTITGFYDISEVFQPATELQLDAPFTDAANEVYNGEPGRKVKGYVGVWNLRPHQSINSELTSNVTALKSVLETASPTIIAGNITRIEFMGFFFGAGGYTIP